MFKKLATLAVSSSILLSSISPIYGAEESSKKNLHEIYGGNRYETCLKLSQKNFTKSDKAILVSGDNFVDAISAGPLSMYENAPLFLVKGDKLDDNTKGEMNRLGVKEALVIGGTTSISDSLVKDLRQMKTTRLSGKNRLDTSLKIYQYLDKNYKLEGAAIANGYTYADALTSSPLVNKNKSALILSDGKILTRYAQDTIKGKKVDIIGGLSSIGKNIEDGIKDSKRISDKNRYETSLNISKIYSANPTSIVLVDANNFIDALSAVSLSKSKEAPILFSSKENKAYVDSLSSVKDVYLVGGKTASTYVTSPNLDTKKIFTNSEWVRTLMAGNLKESKDYKILEVSWGKETDSPDYLKEHIPGAIHFNTDGIEEGPIWNIRKAEEIEKYLLSLGITKDTTVVVYSTDAAGPRAVWTLLWAGVENVKFLDGGLKAWKETGFETQVKRNEPIAVDSFKAKLPVHPEYCLPIEDAVKKLENDKNFRLVSVRSRDEFLGKTSGYTYISRAGEPKGAVWGMLGRDAYSIDHYVHEDGTYKKLDELVKMWDGHGFTLDNDLAFYCGTGWGAAIPWMILYDNGIKSTVYDGGWNEWQMHPELKVQIGDPLTGNVKYTTVKELPTDKMVKK